MAWEQLAIDKPHVAYIILGGFTSLFMLCSLFVKEKLYIGEATVATICGVIFGPHAANLFDPGSWGNVDKITLECSRIVLVVQCFAVGVELPKSYMERHWRSVFILLVPNMTFGWLITSLFIWWMIVPLTWLEALIISACVTATDPVLASSVVGKGKFAKRVPKHLRDVLSAESGCNDGAAFPFIYLSLYLLRYHLGTKEVLFHWTCFTILYECVFGAFFGFMVGYIGRHAIKFADRRNLIDRESFLVFYFVLALFCAGTGSLLGMDDLLIGFAAGVGFSNDGWFTQQTEESHVSNVIDLLLNLAYFVYFGSIIPWATFNNAALGLSPWRLVVIALMVIFFRRIPSLIALKPIIPDVKNWREALFAGHFGPIGVGAIFAAILARAELETDSTQPLADLPSNPEEANYLVIQLIWPVVSFLVMTSILVHGSSIAVFTLGKRINTLTLTMTYTQAQEPSWLNRLPRISSVARSTMSKAKDDDEDSDNEKLPFPPGTLGPQGFPGNFLRRQREEDNPSRAGSRSSSLRPSARHKRNGSDDWNAGPIEKSAIEPQRRTEALSPDSAYRPSYRRHKKNASKKSAEGEEPMSPTSPSEVQSPDVEAFQEGDHLVVEDEEGNVLKDHLTRGESDVQKAAEIEEARDELAKDDSGEHAKKEGVPHEKNEGEELMDEIAEDLQNPVRGFGKMRQRLEDWNRKRRQEAKLKPVEERLHGPAHAYQYGNTIIVEDEDGEVVKKYDIPARDRKKSIIPTSRAAQPIREGLHRMSTWTGLPNLAKPIPEGEAPADETEAEREERERKEYEDDDRIRFQIGSGTRRMSKADFIHQIQSMDPKARIEAIQESQAPVDVKHEVAQKTIGRKLTSPDGKIPTMKDSGKATAERDEADVPEHSMFESLSRFSLGQPETAAQRRRRRAVDDDGPQQAESSSKSNSGDSPPSGSGSGKSPAPYAEDSDENETPAERRRRLAAIGASTKAEEKQPEGETAAARRRRLAAIDTSTKAGGNQPDGETAAERRRRLAALNEEPRDSSEDGEDGEEGETAAERRRRLAALGEAANDESSSDSDDDGGERQPRRGRKPVPEPIAAPEASSSRVGVRFVDAPTPSQSRVQWKEGYRDKPSSRRK